MSSRHDDPIEHDPTGIRDLLAELPDPGPMPTDLVARISAALADEARTRLDAAGPRLTAAGEQRRPVEVDRLESPRAPEPTPSFRHSGGDDDAAVAAGGVAKLRPASRWRGIPIAAAVVGAVGLGGAVAISGIGQSPEGSAEGSPAARSSDRRTIDQRLAPQTQPGPSPDTGAVDGPDVIDVQVISTGVRYRVDTLGANARFIAGRTAARPATGPVPADVAGAAAGAVATPAGARRCAEALGSATWSAIVVDVTTVDERPAAVLVATSVSGSVTAYAVERSCVPGAPGIIGGPVPVP